MQFTITKPMADRKLMWKIIRESFFILVFAAMLSSLGGLGFEFLREKIIFLIPLIILFPALNDMIGDMGTIVASHFTTLLYMGKLDKKRPFASPEFRRLYRNILLTAVLAAVYLVAVAGAIAWVKGFALSPALFFKILFVALLSTLLMIHFLAFATFLGGLYVYRKGHDPDNYLIPLATSFADLGNMALLVLFVRVFL